MTAAIRTHFKTKKRQKKIKQEKRTLTKEYSKYSETCINRTPSIKRTEAKVPEFISIIYFKWNLY